MWKKRHAVSAAPGQPRCPPVHWRKIRAVARWEDHRTTTTTRTERRVQVSKSCGCRLNGVARLGNTVGPTEVEEVGVNQGDDIFGKVGSLDDSQYRDYGGHPTITIGGWRTRGGSRTNLDVTKTSS